jgi:RNA recognition motif-containing protein
VGNLSFDTTQRGLEALFSELGPVSEVFLPMDRTTGRPRGFAFVQFADASAAARAIERFNGHELDGRPLRVTEAEERQPRAPRVSQYIPDDGPSFGFGMGRDRPPKPKGSRRRLRSKKRSL